MKKSITKLRLNYTTIAKLSSSDANHLVDGKTCNTGSGPWARLTKAWCITIIAALQVSSLNAQWHTNGPYPAYYGGTLAGQINSLIIDSDGIFAGTGNPGAGTGIYLSVDNGNTWVPVDSGLPADAVVTMAVGGSNIYAGTFFNGIYKSENNGDTWTPLNKGLDTSNPVVSLAVIDSSIYAGILNNGIFLSTDNGTSWVTDNNGINSGFYDPIDYSAVLSANGKLYVADGNSGVLVSPLNSAGWSTDTNGLPGWIMSMAVSDSYMYAGGDNSDVYISSDSGSTWHLLQTGIAPGAKIAALAAEGPRVYVAASFMSQDSASIYVSANYGADWKELSAGLPKEIYISALVLNDSTLFAGTSQGVYQLQLADIANSIQSPTGESKNLKLYPNPASYSFIAETENTANQVIRLTDIAGKLILTQPVSNNKTTINVMNLPDGVYIITFKSSQNDVTDKLIIAH